MDVDFSDLVVLADDLDGAADGAAENIVKAVEVSARNVKDDWKDSAKGMAHAPAFPFSITYDLEGESSMSGSSVSAEIGPDKGRKQGALGNLIEYGSSNNPPQGLGHGALQREEKGFQRGVEKAVDDSLKASGL